MTITFSASDLVKKTASEICVRRGEKRPQATEAQLRGNSYADSVSVSPYVEMTSSFYFDGIEIFFSVDEMQERKNGLYLIEYKMIDFGKEDWYFKSSVI